MRRVYTSLNLIVILIFLLPISSLKAQESSAITAVKEFQDSLNTEYRNEETSPLTAEDRMVFTELEFFPIDTVFRIEADFVRTPFESPFEMPTTTERRPIYVKYGEVYFRLQGRDLKLDVFQSLELSAKPEYVDYLFAPFTDLTNGETSYGGGRYLDLRIPEGNKIILDFNKAYNPYCAYNGKYSCPIPPEGNHLEVEIKAGVKAYK